MSNQPSVVEIISLLERKLRNKSNIESLSLTPSFKNYINHWVNKALEYPQPEYLLKRFSVLKKMFSDYASQNVDERKKTLQKSKKLLKKSFFY